MKTVRITHPFEHVGTTEMSIWMPKDQRSEYAGRFTIAVSNGITTSHLRPTRKEMIALRNALDEAMGWVDGNEVPY